MISPERMHWPFTSVQSHFGQGIAADHLRINRDGTVRISLTGNCPEFIQSLASLGEAIVTTRNRTISLTEMGHYPDFEVCPCGNIAHSPARDLMFDLSAWHQVWAARRQGQDGIWRTVSVFGLDDFAHHQILLLDQARERHFAQLARRFQGSPPALNHPWNRAGWRKNNAFARQPSGHLERLRQRKHEVLDNGVNGARAIHPEGMREVWGNVMSERLWLETTVVTAPVIHGVLWQPASLAETSTGFTLSSNKVLLHCHSENIAGLWVVPLSPKPDSPCALEAYDKDDQLLFALTVPPGWDHVWRELLHWLPVV